VQIPPSGAQGVVICLGGSMSGWTLYLQNGVPAFTYNYLGHELTAIAAAKGLPEGPLTLGLSFNYDGGGLGKGASVALSVGDAVAATGRIEKTVPFRFTGRIDRIDATVGLTPGDRGGRRTRSFGCPVVTTVCAEDDPRV